VFLFLRVSFPLQALDSAMSSEDPPLVAAPPSRMDSDPDFEDALAAHALPPSQIEAKDNEVSTRDSSGNCSDSIVDHF
jgi:hypothetical protein